MAAILHGAVRLSKRAGDESRHMRIAAFPSSSIRSSCTVPEYYIGMESCHHQQFIHHHINTVHSIEDPHTRQSRHSILYRRLAKKSSSGHGDLRYIMHGDRHGVGLRNRQVARYEYTDDE